MTAPTSQAPDPSLRPPLHLPLTRRASSLLQSLYDQQFWLWGRDIENPSRNLLREYGFIRHLPPPETDTPSRAYVRNLEDGNRIRLWAFGAAIEWNGIGLYLQRAGLRAGFFDPNKDPPTHFPLTQPLSKRPHPMPPPRSPLLAQALFSWIADYEEWIRQSQLEGYRRDLAQHHKLSLIPGDELVNAWRMLALDMGDLRELDSSKCPEAFGLTRLQTLVNGHRLGNGTQGRNRPRRSAREAARTDSEKFQGV